MGVLRDIGWTVCMTALPLAASFGCNGPTRVGQQPGGALAAHPPGATAPGTAPPALAVQPTPEPPRRGPSLDENNQQLHTLVAQLQQQLRMREDESTSLRDQLRGTTEQLARIQSEKDTLEKKTTTLVASMRRQGSAVITANSSLRDSLPRINVEGVTSRVDDDVIRIELPVDRLFAAESSQWLSGGAEIVDKVAAEMKQAYPDQVIGIEGHTDNAPPRGGQFYNNHQLSVTRALAVMELLSSRGYYPQSQMMLVGHGANHPVASNASAVGKQRNRRIELVVYPDKAGRR